MPTAFSHSKNELQELKILCFYHAPPSIEWCWSVFKMPTSIELARDCIHFIGTLARLQNYIFISDNVYVSSFDMDFHMAHVHRLAFNCCCCCNALFFPINHTRHDDALDSPLEFIGIHRKLMMLVFRCHFLPTVWVCARTRVVCLFTILLFN